MAAVYIVKITSMWVYIMDEVPLTDATDDTAVFGVLIWFMSVSVLQQRSW